MKMYAPRQTYRFVNNGRAFVNFSLKEAPQESSRCKSIWTRPENKCGSCVTPADTGMNRIVWDLHYDGPRLIALRTTPPENPHIWEEPRFKGAEFAADHALGNVSVPRGAASSAGKIFGEDYGERPTYSQPLELVKDPKSKSGVGC